MIHGSRPEVLRPTTSNLLSNACLGIGGKQADLGLIEPVAMRGRVLNREPIPQQPPAFSPNRFT